jgi:hypothetical protein
MPVYTQDSSDSMFMLTGFMNDAMSALSEFRLVSGRTYFVEESVYT